VYSFTKFGLRGFTESLRQEVTQRHVRVGVLEPGGVATELGSHNTPEVRNEMIDPFYAKWGMKMAQAFSPEMKDANLDWDSITAIIQEGEQGKIVEVEDEVDHKTVEVWVE
jgi:NAD(P)-dependent dehydrogenase (short-subunit alcohol dehydrogenase family)